VPQRVRTEVVGQPGTLEGTLESGLSSDVWDGFPRPTQEHAGGWPVPAPEGCLSGACPEAVDRVLNS
jgi:hypothetical protein